MHVENVVGVTLVGGLVVFLVGAAAWRMDYERPLAEALPMIHGDRRRRAWIHLWMIPAMFVTSAGIAGFASTVADDGAAALAFMACVIYALGAATWVVALTFRLMVVPWAAERMVDDGHPPASFPPLDRWAGSLYIVHMASAYAAFAVLGVAVVLGRQLPSWVGWLGVAWGAGFLLGFVATRFAGPFNPPFIAHAYTAALGLALLSS